MGLLDTRHVESNSLLLTFRRAVGQQHVVERPRVHTKTSFDQAQCCHPICRLSLVKSNLAKQVSHGHACVLVAIVGGCQSTRFRCQRRLHHALDSGRTPLENIRGAPRNFNVTGRQERHVSLLRPVIRHVRPTGVGERQHTEVGGVDRTSRLGPGCASLRQPSRPANRASVETATEAVAL